MVRMELLKKNESIVSYKYFPESSVTYGIVSLDLITGKRTVEKIHPEYDRWYAIKALQKMKRLYENRLEFPEKTAVCWY